MIIAASIVAGILAGRLLTSCIFSEARGLWDGFVNWWDLPASENRMPRDDGLDGDGLKFLLVVAFAVLCGVLTYFGLHHLFG